MFPLFSRGLKKHSARGYHVSRKTYSPSEVLAWQCTNAIQVPRGYAEFLTEFGSGSYFGGALVIFPLSGDNFQSVAAFTARVRETGNEELVAFAYERTTEGCYCFFGNGRNEQVYWFSFPEKKCQALSASFVAWVESLPEEFFVPLSYKAFGQVRNVEAICDVIEQREAFEIRLIGYERELVRPPGKAADFLPRYNRVTFAVFLKRPVKLKWLTVRIRRMGSSAGEANTKLLSLKVEKVQVGEETIITEYVFDSFNLPFSDMEVELEPIIDLGAKSRVGYTEIREYL